LTKLTANSLLIKISKNP